MVWAFTRWVLSPVRHTARAAERLASGLLAERLSIQGEDEISTLARSFNHMATSLEDQIERLESLSKVQRLSSPTSPTSCAPRWPRSAWH